MQIRKVILMKTSNQPVIKLNIEDKLVKFSVTNGWHAEFIGADFPQLVDDSLRIHTPLNDTYATLSFRCTSGDAAIEKDVKLEIKGIYKAYEKKPNIIPEPAQWHAFGGVNNTICTYSYDTAFEDEAEAFAEEYFKLTGKAIEHVSTHSDLSFSFERSAEYLGDEGYEIECTENKIVIKACKKAGAIWAGKTVCQLIIQGGFPCGIMRDYPRYSVRGFMLDVGRKPVSLASLDKIADYMSWYKMNDFQIHLGDNYIWLEDYAQNGDESTFDAYQAFRLESSIKNQKGETPTSKDYSYSKAEFNDFIKRSLKKGVRITPEIDMPAHALAFTKVFPEYAVKGKVSPLMKKRPLTDHIDVSKPEAIEFVKKIFDEYTLGSDPVFPRETTIHIGADEFLSDYRAYRRFINELVPHIKKTNTVRLWGGLTWIKDSPETPIIKEAIENVEMNLWSSNWADGKEMYDMGFKLINTIDHQLYIVPNGTKIRAPYMDFINKRRAFKQFEPGRVRIKDKGRYVDLPAGNKQLIGACYAIWQDNIDKRSKGINEQDLFDRFIDSAAFMAEKTWGSCTDKHTSKEVDEAAAAINKRIKCRNKPFKTMTDISLKGGSSYVSTDCFSLDTGKKLQIQIEFDEVVPGQILMEADAPYGSYDIRITKNGKLGFTCEYHEYEFDYKPIPNKKLCIIIDTKPLRTILKSGLFIRKRATGIYSFDGKIRNTNIRNSSFSIPTARIGSKTNSVKAHIFNICEK